MTARFRRAATTAAVCVFLTACEPPEPPPQSLPPPQAAYVGSDACADCHSGSFERWSGSHHDLAMRTPTPATVVGDFDSASFTKDGVTTRFHRQDDAYFVDTDGPSGAVETYRVAYTFGIEPLQQYLLETEPGRLQALGVAWDARPGGQGWFHLYPDERIAHDDVLHWTSDSQNWNSICADCHSTDVRKGLDAGTGSFATAYSVMNVGCEACHGPGSLHAAAPEADYGAAAVEIDTCAPCHSRRAQLAEGFRPGAAFLDHYLPAVVTPPLYHADGQIQDEVYVYGSFLQSRMYQQGVTCGNCHDPHTAEPLLAGDALCTQCHSENARPDFPTLTARRYDDPSHHFHDDVQCVDCHMPSKVYMGVDDRRDHGFRVPRPDLTLRFDVPNACNGCHEDRSPTWAADEIARRTGAPPVPGAADVLALATTQRFDAERALSEAATDASLPGLVRRSALLALGPYEFGFSQDAIAAGLRDVDPFVRLGALEHLSRLPDAPRLAALRRLLRDPLRAVRVSAAPAAAPLLAGSVAPADRALIEDALEEHRAVQELNAERPEAHTNLAVVHAALGDDAAAEAALRRALDIAPHWIPALVNLADLYRASGRDDEGGAHLAEAARMRPPSSEAAYAYGLWLFRQDQPARALEQLQRAHELDPEHLRNGYVYALALHNAGEGASAITVLEENLAKFGGHRATLEALATISRDLGETGAARDYAERLVATFGARYEGLVREIEAGG